MSRTNIKKAGPAIALRRRNHAKIMGYLKVAFDEMNDAAGALFMAKFLIERRGPLHDANEIKSAAKRIQGLHYREAGKALRFLTKLTAKKSDVGSVSKRRRI